ncbi:hypothetical protein CFP56_021188 [Quercus suber]|uniref:Uncharacterized protein n=1 Tax=Quercus suber TaxID=58331 RepID=A0AAW0KFR1_QUESU
MQFGRKLGLPQDMKCLGVKIDLHSHHKLSHQIDFSSWDSYVDNDSYGFVRDDIISWVCDVKIFINGHK